jgi:uncharacterized repeat protein (TIGR01451 family)
VKLANSLRAIARMFTPRRRTSIVVAAAVALAALAAGIVAGGSPSSTTAAGTANAPTTASANTLSRELAGRLAGRVRRQAPDRSTAHFSLLQERVGNVIVGHSYKNTVSRPLRSLPPVLHKPVGEREASRNPTTGRAHRNAPDGARQTRLFAPKMHGTMLNFDGVAFPGVSCFCAPPDTNGEVGATQYVQIVNQAIQVFDKTDGSSLLDPTDIATLWQGFGGVCETDTEGDPVVVYDQLANRWVVSQFAGINTSGGAATDECIAVSTSNNATGTWNLYGFHLGTHFFDYPKLAVWPDGYYMSDNVFDASTSDYLGPQAFAFNRAAMLAGNPATFVTKGITGGPTEDPFLPADLDGSTPPPVNAPDPFVEFPGNNTYKVYRFHADFTTPANTTFTLAGSPAAAAFTLLCGNTRSCVPQLGTTDGLDALADRPMFRAAYRNFGVGGESLVSNFTVSSNGVAGVRWFQLNNVTSGTPTVVQESTYQPDTTWRWLGSAAQDSAGDLALGFSASSAAIHPQIRYAGRLAGDTPNTLAQGEATLFAGKGSQADTGNRWGDYSDMTIDPVDDCTFWYTNEYLADDGTFNWRTRIGNFKFPGCGPAAAAVSINKTADAGQVNAGAQIGFNVTLDNSGDAQATGLAVTDDLPAGSGVNWSIDNANTDAGWSVTGTPPNQSLAYAQTMLNAGASTHVHVISGTTSASGGEYDNTASFTTDNGTGSDSASVIVAAPPPCGSPQGFDNVGALSGAGWYMQNNSNPVGASGWFQGNPAVFTSQAGADDAYIGANFQDTGDVGTISNWLLTPTVSLQNGETLIFFTRTVSNPATFPDRLQVRMSTNGGSTNVGSTETSVGDFGTLLLDINPTYTATGYPGSWTRYDVTVSGVPSPVTGRFAFRYFVEDGGALGSNSNYIGIDTVCTPPPAPPPPPPPPPPAFRTLNVFKAGAGAGTVTSSPSGLNCGPVCTAQFSNGTSVTLTEAPSSSSKFSGWSGDCSGTATTCVLSMTADHTVTATFAKKPKCKVPKVVGLTLAKAKAKIRRAHCGVGEIKKKVSSRKKKGHVLSQKPKPGKTLPAGSKVNLTVGKGPRH